MNGLSLVTSTLANPIADKARNHCACTAVWMLIPMASLANQAFNCDSCHSLHAHATVCIYSRCKSGLAATWSPCFRASSRAHLPRPLQTVSAVQRALPLERQPGLRSTQWDFERRQGCITESVPSVVWAGLSICPSAVYLRELLSILLSVLLSEGQSS